MEQAQQPVVEEEEQKPVANEIYKFSVKRIKKKINDYILNNYSELFFSNKDEQTGSGSSEGSPSKSSKVIVPDDYQNKLLTPDDFVKHPKIL